MDHVAIVRLRITD